MKRTICVAALAAAGALAACVPVEPPAAVPGPDACGASGLQYLVGRTEGALAAMTFPAERLRVIRPGMAVTQDYRGDRLNIFIDATGRIARVYCG